MWLLLKQGGYIRFQFFQERHTKGVKTGTRSSIADTCIQRVVLIGRNSKVRIC